MITNKLNQFHGSGYAVLGQNMALLAKCGVHTTLEDLLLYLSLRYEDQTHITPIAQLSLGKPV